MHRGGDRRRHGHTIGSVEHILSTYLPRDNEVAWNAQVRRGLILALKTGRRGTEPDRNPQRVVDRLVRRAAFGSAPKGQKLMSYRMLVGGPAGIRTQDHSIKSRMLYH